MWRSPPSLCNVAADGAVSRDARGLLAEGEEAEEDEAEEEEEEEEGWVFAVVLTLERLLVLA